MRVNDALSWAALVSTARVVGGTATTAPSQHIGVLESNVPTSFVLGGLSPTSLTFKYRALTSTRFAVISAHSGTGLVRMTITRPGWMPNSTVSRDPGLSIDFGIDGSVLQNPADDGGCIVNAVGWKPPPNETEITITISMFTVYASSTNYSTNVVLSASPYAQTAPIPGGCCLTCSSNADATLVIRDKGTYDASIVLHQSSPASYQWSWSQCPCDAVADVNAAPILQYELYFYFIGSCGSSFQRKVSETSVGQAFSRMSTVEGVLKYGTKLSGLPLLPAHLEEYFHVDATAGQGVIYAVLATDTQAQALEPKLDSKQFMAVYAPYSTFRCRVEGAAAVNCSAIRSRVDCDLYPECVWELSALSGTCVLDPDVLSCDGLFSARDLALTLIVGAFGLFVALFGHRYFLTQLAIDSLILFATISYIALVAVRPTLTSSNHLWLSIGGGVLGAGLILYWWFLSRGIAISLVVTGGVCGVVLTAFVFSTPFGEYRVWENPFNFGMAAVCGLLIPPIFMMLWDRTCAIGAASITGSYFFLCAIDFFVASSFDDMVMNVVRRLTGSNFGKDYSGNIFSDEFNGCSDVHANVTMLAAWAGMSVLCMVFQFKVSAKLPKDARRGAGSPPVSDRFDGQWCPLQCTMWCKQGGPKRSLSRRRRTEGWSDTEEESHPLVEVSGSAFRGSTSSWGSWAWMRNAARRGSMSRRSSQTSNNDSPGRVFQSPEGRPLLDNRVVAGSRRGSSRAVVYEDDDDSSYTLTINA